MQFVSTVLIVAALINSGRAFTLSGSKVDDITVSNSNGVMQCDKIECPRYTVRCHVSKRNSDEHKSKITREITCYGENDKVLQKKSWSEVYAGNKKVNIQVDMHDDGRTSIFKEGNTIGFNQDFFEQIFSTMQQIGGYFSGLQDFFLNPFSRMV